MKENKTAITKITPIEEFRGQLVKMKSQFAIALPPNIKPERFVRIAVTAIQNNPKLLNLDRHSLYSSFMKCAQDGLLPDGREAAIVPRAGEATYNPMVAGICKKVRNSGELKTINAVVVCEFDEYDQWVDQGGEHFIHRKAKGDRGKVLLTYAYAITKDGGFYLEEIDEEQMKAIEKMSQAKTGPWKGAFKDEMRRKSAIKRLCKYRLPMSTDLIDGILRADDVIEPKTEPSVEKPAIEEPIEPKTSSKLTAIVNESDAKTVETNPSPPTSPPLRQREPGDDDEDIPDMPI